MMSDSWLTNDSWFTDDILFMNHEWWWFCFLNESVVSDDDDLWLYVEWIMNHVWIMSGYDDDSWMNDEWIINNGEWLSHNSIMIYPWYMVYESWVMMNKSLVILEWWR